MASRSLIEIIADMDDNIPLPQDEVILVSRLAAHVPPRTASDFRCEWYGLVRDIVECHAPASAKSVSAKALWLDDRFHSFIAGADWRSTRHVEVCQIADPLRALLWRLSYGLAGSNKVDELTEERAAYIAANPRLTSAERRAKKKAEAMQAGTWIERNGGREV